MDVWETIMSKAKVIAILIILNNQIAYNKDGMW